MIYWRVNQNARLASYRLRCGIPMRELRKHGIDSEIGVGPITVFSKHWNDDDFDEAKYVKKQHGRVIFDLCDDHFDGDFSDHYRKMIDLADVVVVSTCELAKVVKLETGRECKVISDPYEYPKEPPKENNRARNVLWFGHSANLPTIAREIERLQDRSLLVVSNIEELQGAKVMRWSREAMLHAFAWADVVIIPVGDQRKDSVKSPNRMVESIRQGLYVVANALDAYAPYGMWQGDIQEGLKWLEANQNEAKQQVLAAQNVVEELNSPAVIGAQWLEVFREYHDLL